MKYTCAEIAKKFGKSRQSVWAMIRKGVLSAEMIEGVFYIDESEFEKLPFKWRRSLKNVDFDSQT